MVGGIYSQLDAQREGAMRWNPQGVGGQRAMSKPQQSHTEATIFECLRARFPAPAFLLLPQVRNGTGYAKRVRTADALAVSVWPSRGLYFAGIEIKVSRSDWERERRDPEKSAAIQKYCRHWWIAAPVDVVPVADLPPTWGLLEIDGNKTHVQRDAPTLEPIAPDAAFVCAVLRAATECMVPRDSLEERSVEARITKAYTDGKADGVIARNHQLTTLQAAVSAFEQASGVSISNRWDNDQIGEAGALVRRIGLEGIEERIRRLRSEATAMAEALAAVPTHTGA